MDLKPKMNMCQLNNDPKWSKHIWVVNKFMVKLNMIEKGFEADVSFNETPNVKSKADKPLKDKENQIKVDINVLKARAQQLQDKENKKNIITFIFFLVLLGTVGIYLSI